MELSQQKRRMVWVPSIVMSLFVCLSTRITPKHTETYRVGLQLIDGQLLHENFGIVRLLNQLWLESDKFDLHVVDQHVRLQQLRQTILHTIARALQLPVYTHTLCVGLHSSGRNVGGVGSVVERRSLADVLSLSCARPAADG